MVSGSLVGGSVEFRDPQEVTVRWVRAPLSLEASGLGDLRTGAGRRACGPLRLACQGAEKRSSFAQRFCLPPPQWSLGCGGGCVPRQGSGGG